MGHTKMKDFFACFALNIFVYEYVCVCECFKTFYENAFENVFVSRKSENRK